MATTATLSPSAQLKKAEVSLFQPKLVIFDKVSIYDEKEAHCLLN
jgi:hypothetical protein